jgi:hypothetical protein
MPVLHLVRPLVAVTPELPGEEEEATEHADPVTRCLRCRLSFNRHPSVTPANSAKWQLCPRCRLLLLAASLGRNSPWT